MSGAFSMPGLGLAAAAVVTGREINRAANSSMVKQDFAGSKIPPYQIVFNRNECTTAPPSFSSHGKPASVQGFAMRRLHVVPHPKANGVEPFSGR